MAGEDEVFEGLTAPEAADLVDRPDEWYADDDEVLVICDVEFAAQEFTEAERLEWIKIREKYQLSETEARYRDLLTDMSQAERSNLLKAKQKRLEVVQNEINRVVEETNPLEWTDKLEGYVAELTQEADKLEGEIGELEKPINQHMYERMDEMQGILSDLKAKRDPAFLEMAWKIARASHNEKRTLEQWLNEAKGSDRLFAQELVFKGNFTWEAPRLNREQRRQLAKSSRSKKQNSTIGNTDSTSSKQ